jgi:hypothetical protein
MRLYTRLLMLLTALMIPLNTTAQSTTAKFAAAAPVRPDYPASKHGGTYMFNYYLPPTPSTTPWSPDGTWIAVATLGDIISKQRSRPTGGQLDARCSSRNPIILVVVHPN